jgi:hypothetical protein
MSQARELLATCRPYIEAFPLGGDDIAITTLRQGLTVAVKNRKRAVATAALTREFGLTWDEVFNFSQVHPDDPIFIDAWRLIRSLGLGAELIVSTFTDDEALSAFFPGAAFRADLGDGLADDALDGFGVGVGIARRDVLHGALKHAPVNRILDEFREIAFLHALRGQLYS